MKNEAVKRQGLLLCLVGPSGGGKSTLEERLLRKHGGGSLVKSVSLTTRLPRPGEQEGQAYHFVGREEFERRAGAGELFEWEEVHGNLYGASRAFVENAVAAGRDVLLNIEIKGAFKYKECYPKNTLIVFVVPPDAGVLAERIRSRCAASPEEISRRMGTAEREYRAFVNDVNGPGRVDFLVVNDDLEQSYCAVEAILAAARCRTVLFDKSALAKLCSFREA